ncbi:MAG: hypothetical protein WAV05_13060 [Anaerolineales bacterium]
MFDFLTFKRDKSKRDLLDIETILQSSLKPISPRPEFIQSLQRSLMDYTFPSSDSADLDIKKMILFAVVGFVSMIFIFSLWIRLIVVIISSIGMLQTSKSKKVLSD